MGFVMEFVRLLGSVSVAGPRYGGTAPKGTSGRNFMRGYARLDAR